MAFMKFYTGSEANAQSYLDGIYLATDTHKLFYKGSLYGGDPYVELDWIQDFKSGSGTMEEAAFEKLKDAVDNYKLLVVNCTGAAHSTRVCTPEIGDDGSYICKFTDINNYENAEEYILAVKIASVNPSTRAITMLHDTTYPLGGKDIDLSNYYTIAQVDDKIGTNVYTGANYISKETNLTDAVLQLDVEIKATNDNLTLEHENAEATYAKKTELSNYLTIEQAKANYASFSRMKVADEDTWANINVNGYIVSYPNDLPDQAENGPFSILGGNQATVIQVNPSSGSSGYSAQLAIGFERPRLAYRSIISDSGVLKWSDWKKVLTWDNIEDKPDVALKSEIPDVSTYLTKTAASNTYQPKGNYLTAIPSEYVTDSELNAKGYQTESQVAAKVSALVDSAPETLNTLNELAAALGDDPNFATTITNQIAGKANASHTHEISDITNLQSTLNGKAASSHTHPVSQITGLTANRALVSDSSGHPAVSAVTSTELGYLDGVTSNVQTQLNGKAASSHTHTASQVSGLSRVATTNSYDDLDDKPSIPSIEILTTVEVQSILNS